MFHHHDNAKMFYGFFVLAPLILYQSYRCEVPCGVVLEGTPATLACTWNNTDNATALWWRVLGSPGLNLSACNTTSCTDHNASFYGSVTALSSREFNSTLRIQSYTRQYRDITVVTNSTPPMNCVLQCVPDVYYLQKGAAKCWSSGLTVNSRLLNLTCQAYPVFPPAKCDFSVYKPHGEEPWRPDDLINYTHARNGSDSFYSTTCAIHLPVADLTEGTWRFTVQMYPNVTGNVNDSVQTINITEIRLRLPQVALSSDCSKPNLSSGYILLGTTVTCTCRLVDRGHPPGHAQWYYDNGTQVGVVENTENVTMTFASYVNVSDVHRTDEQQIYRCAATSALGGRSDSVNFTSKYASSPHLQRQMPSSFTASRDGRVFIVVPVWGAPPPDRFRLTLTHNDSKFDVWQETYTVTYTKRSGWSGEVTLAIKGVKADDALVYILNMGNNFGRDLSFNFTLKVDDKKATDHKASLDTGLLTALGVVSGVTALTILTLAFVVLRLLRTSPRQNREALVVNTSPVYMNPELDQKEERQYEPLKLGPASLRVESSNHETVNLDTVAHQMSGTHRPNNHYSRTTVSEQGTTASGHYDQSDGEFQQETYANVRDSTNDETDDMTDDMIDEETDDMTDDVIDEETEDVYQN
ncbi:unnamed protein product [Lymnaea stagnalis]|uniref:Ig-like domain-containing protein n=1 Tax=Lymnaea stagnalis TaxID=6523 RepID=A0AAV2I012_LYMST